MRSKAARTSGRVPEPPTPGRLTPSERPPSVAATIHAWSAAVVAMPGILIPVACSSRSRSGSRSSRRAATTPCRRRRVRASRAGRRHRARRSRGRRRGRPPVPRDRRVPARDPRPPRLRDPPPRPSPPRRRPASARRRPLPAARWADPRRTGRATSSIRPAPGWSASRRHWTEPKLSCPTKGDRSVAIWVGIDGAGAVSKARPLIQVGTWGYCHNGVENHYAWHEVYPNQPYSVGFVTLIHPGDRIAAAVVFRQRAFTLTLVNLTTGRRAEVVEQAPKAVRGTRRMDRRGADRRLSELPSADPAELLARSTSRRRARRSVRRWPGSTARGRASGRRWCRGAGPWRRSVRWPLRAKGSPSAARRTSPWSRETECRDPIPVLRRIQWYRSARSVRRSWPRSNSPGDRGPATNPPSRGASSCPERERVGFGDGDGRSTPGGRGRTGHRRALRGAARRPRRHAPRRRSARPPIGSST